MSLLVSNKIQTFFFSRHKINSHSIIKSAICEICGKGFATELLLKKHKVLHGDYEYSCEHCGKMFPVKTRLVYHINR